MEYELPFIIMVNTPDNVLLVKQKIQTLFSEAVDKGVRVINLQEQRIEIRPNNLADPQAASAADGFLNFPIQIEVTPQIENQTIDNQIAFAKRFDNALKGVGYQTVVCADFEELMNNPANLRPVSCE